jgi:Domain of unknown function (DUF4845)
MEKTMFKKQRGMGLMSLILALALGAIVIIFGSQMGLGYMTQQTLKGIVKNALLESKSMDNATPKTIKYAINKKLSVNTLEIKDDAFDIVKVGNGYEVSTEYIKEVKITDKVKIVMDLSFVESSQ